MMKSLTPIAALLALSVSGAALAEEMMAPAAAGTAASEGKCGGMKAEEGKAGEKAAEGKCGGMKHHAGHKHEGHKKGMKEGQCGGMKAEEGKCGAKK